MTKAIILLSGGVDSTVVLALAKQRGLNCYALSFDYGQSHRCELDAARSIAKEYAVMDHKIISVALHEWGGSALTDDLFVQDQNKAAVATYVPARNTVFLSIALSYAEAVGAEEIHVGFNLDDHHHYPDCRQSYLDAFSALSSLATSAGEQDCSIKVCAPLITKSKQQVMQTAEELSIPLSLTWSCYFPQASGAACGVCDACLLRRK